MRGLFCDWKKNMLSDGFHDIPPGKVAAVVTHLEMRSRAEYRDCPVPTGCRLIKVDRPGADWYTQLFRIVGASDWLWFSRLRMSDAALEDIIQDPKVHVYSLRRGDRDLGLLELDFRETGACELAYFGLAGALIGQGAGRFLMNEAMRLAWAQPIQRFHVHTCTLDSPQALGFYIRSGFTPVRQQIEIAPDPRLDGLIERDAAPQVPIINP